MPCTSTGEGRGRAMHDIQRIAHLVRLCELRGTTEFDVLALRFL
jgi:hypothetical protein